MTIAQQFIAGFAGGRRSSPVRDERTTSISGTPSSRSSWCHESDPASRDHKDRLSLCAAWILVNVGAAPWIFDKGLRITPIASPRLPIQLNDPGAREARTLKSQIPYFKFSKTWTLQPRKRWELQRTVWQ